MIHYYQAIQEDGVTCSIDMIRLKLDFSSEEKTVAFGKWLSAPHRLYVETYPNSFKQYSYRNLFKITCSNDQSFVLGLSLNGNNKDSYYLGFLEFNPNKVADQREFRKVYDMLRTYCFCAEVVRWDLAVDVPLRRDMCILQKDKRTYHLIQNSSLDKDEKLGQRNKSGYVKLYNKSLESGLDIDMTRLEITIGGNLNYEDFVKILPRVEVKGEQQVIDPYLDLKDTDIVLYELLMKCDLTERQEYIKRLGRGKAQKLKPYLRGSVYDSDKFVVSHDIYRQLRHQLREWTIGIKYTLLDDWKELND